MSRPQIAVYAAIGICLLLLGVRAVRETGAEQPQGGAGEGVSLSSSPVGAAGGSGEATGGDVVVHVAGEVAEPGVYRLPAGSRVADAVDRAGGATGRADPDAINLAARLADGQQVVVPSRGAGGTMALRTAWSDPERYAGVVAINGPLPNRLSPLRRVNELRRVPCLLTTSRDSRKYPSDQVCQDLRLLHVAGCTVALRQYPAGDELTSNMLSDLDRWLMDLVCRSNG